MIYRQNDGKQDLTQIMGCLLVASYRFLTAFFSCLFLTGCLATYGGKDPASPEGELVSYTYEYDGRANHQTAAVLRVPSADSKTPKPAVIILHDGGGWVTERTRQYADLLTRNGYITLEPRLFRDSSVPRNFMMDLASLYGALDFLAQNPQVDAQRIYAMGKSAGAMLTILAKTQMAEQRFNRSNTSFRALASFYPVCWYFLDLIDGKSPKLFESFSAQDMKSWQPMPIRLFVPEFDDYDDRDSTVCSAFVAKIPNPKDRETFIIEIYEGATHGWDHGRTYSFDAWGACKGRGCINTNEWNPEVTEQGYKDLLQFFSQN